MSRNLLAGRHLIVGFPGTDIGPEIRFALKDLGAGGVILFTRNFEAPAQLRELVTRLRELSGHDRLFVCVDQEGGPVQRFRAPFTDWPDMRAFAEHGDEDAARRFGAFVARELAAVGVDWNFAPVCDVNTRAENPVIGRRAFGADAATVERFALAVVDGIQGEGLLACAKHFPGHGDTTADSHKDLPVVDLERERLERVEIAPFRAAAQAEVASFMTAHVKYPALDADFPATLSEPILGGIARTLPYDGLIVSDDLEMAAIADFYGIGDAAVRAMHAGCDLLLCCHEVTRQEEIVRAIRDAIGSRRLNDADLADKTRRIRRAESTFPLRAPVPLDEIGRDEHQELAERVR